MLLGLHLSGSGESSTHLTSGWAGLADAYGAEDGSVQLGLPSETQTAAITEPTWVEHGGEIPLSSPYGAAVMGRVLHDVHEARIAAEQAALMHELAIES